MNLTQTLLDSMHQACRWLIDIAQAKHARLSDEPGTKTSLCDYPDWRGAIGEYNARDKSWIFFGAIWHTGQAVRALVRAWKLLQDPVLLNGAKYSADFILRNRVADPADDDYGLILAFEDYPDKVNVSGMIECLGGLVDLGEVTGDPVYRTAALAAVKWAARKSFIPSEGLFRDVYAPQTRDFISNNIFGVPGRPLAEDAEFLILGRLINDDELKNICFQTLDRLIRDEDPPGNWIKYPPCNPQRGNLHPRHAFWWGSPFIDAYLETGEDRYLQVALRAARWYVQAQRRDGGFFRGTYLDFTTDSFGHATSGMACAIKMWARLWAITKSEEWLTPIGRGLKFCRMMQITNPADENMRGCIVEKIYPPDGTDRPPFGVRDLASIFYIQAVCEVIDRGLDKDPHIQAALRA